MAELKEKGHPWERAKAFDGAALFTSDGQVSQPLGAGDCVHIRRGEHDLKLIHPRGYDYFNILRNKLHWGRGQAASNP